MVVLGQGDHVALAGDLQAAAARHLHVGAFELADERPVALEHRHVEAVAMGIADEDVAGVADVDSVGEIGDSLAADSAQKRPVVAEHHDAVALERAGRLASMSYNKRLTLKSQTKNSWPETAISDGSRM